MYLEHNNKTYYCTTGDVEKPYLQYDKYKIPMTYSSSSVPSSFTDYPNQSTFGYGNYRNKVEASTSSSTSYGYSGVSSRQSTSGYSGWSGSTYTQRDWYFETKGYADVTMYSSYQGYYVYYATADRNINSTGVFWSNATSKLGSYGGNTCRVILYGGSGLPYFNVNVGNTTTNIVIKNSTGAVTCVSQIYFTNTFTSTIYTTTNQYGILNDQTALTRQSDFYTTSVEKGIMSNTTLLSTSNSTTSLY